MDNPTVIELLLREIEKKNVILWDNIQEVYIKIGDKTISQKDAQQIKDIIQNIKELSEALP